MCPSTSRDDRAKAQEASYFVHRLRSPLPDSAETRRLWSTTKINSAKRKGSRSGNPASSAGSLDSCSPRDARVSAWIRYPCRAQPLNFLNYANWSAPVQRSCSIQRLKTKMSMNFLVQFVKKRSDVKELLQLMNFYRKCFSFSLSPCRQVLQNNNIYFRESLVFPLADVAQIRSSFRTISKNIQNFSNIEFFYLRNNCAYHCYRNYIKLQTYATFERNPIFNLR